MTARLQAPRRPGKWDIETLILTTVCMLAVGGSGFVAGWQVGRGPEEDFPRISHKLRWEGVPLTGSLTPGPDDTYRLFVHSDDVKDFGSFCITFGLSEPISALQEGKSDIPLRSAKVGLAMTPEKLKKMTDEPVKAMTPEQRKSVGTAP